MRLSLEEYGDERQELVVSETSRKQVEWWTRFMILFEIVRRIDVIFGP